MTQATGGYILLQSPLIRTGVHQHTSALKRPVSQTDLDALNAVQATRWRINQWVLDAMREVWIDGRELAGLEKARTVPVPGKLADDVWEAMSDADRKAHIGNLREIHERNATA
jgi:DNA-directed RNA polymerase